MFKKTMYFHWTKKKQTIGSRQFQNKRVISVVVINFNWTLKFVLDFNWILEITIGSH